MTDTAASFREAFWHLRKAARLWRWNRVFALARTLREACPDWDVRLLIAETKQDWAGVLAAVPRDGPRALSQTLARHHNTALIQLGLLREGVETACLQTARFPDDPVFRTLHRQGLEKMGKLEAATKVARDEWAAAPEALPALMSLLLQQGQTAEAAATLREAEARAEGTAPLGLCIARRLLADARGDVDAALAALEELPDLVPDAASLALRQMSQCALRHDQPGLQARAWEAFLRWQDDPRHTRDWLEHGPIILRTQWRFTPDRQALAPHAAALEAQILPQTPALVMRDVLMQMGDYDRAAALVERSARAFPASVSLWREALRLHARMKNNSTCDRLRRDLRAALPEQSAWDAICHNHSRAWDMAELPEMIRHGYTTPVFRVTDVFKSVLQRIPRLPAEALTMLNEVAGQADPIDAQGITLLLARQRQIALWETARSEPVLYARFTEARDRLVVDLETGRQRIASMSDRDYAGNPGRQLIIDTLGRLRGAEDTEGLWCPHTAEALADAVEIAAWIVERIRTGIATALIRLGDGEGHFLPLPRRAHGPLIDHLQQDQRAMMELWWNRDWPDAATKRRITDQFRRAVSRADMLGIVPEARVLRIYQTQGKLVTSNRGVARVRAYIAYRRAPGQAVTSTQLQRDLAEWGLWADVLRAIPDGQIRWIGPHEMAGVLNDRFALTTAHRILIPGEAKYTGLFDPDTARPGTLIDYHDTVLGEVTQQAAPGQVWLVAAGFLGKIYCDRIRMRGGIALDIGSLVDDWMGYATRVVRAGQGPVMSSGQRNIPGLPRGLRASP